MTQLTARTALEECLAMWEWLSTRPHATKDDYLDVKGVVDGRPAYDCYACEHALQQRNETDPLDKDDDDWDVMISTVCQHCPMWDQGHSDDRLMCVRDEDSPFRMWEEPDEYIEVDTDTSHGMKVYEKWMRNAAQGVADLARLKLDELLQAEGAEEAEESETEKTQ